MENCILFNRNTRSMQDPRSVKEKISTRRYMTWMDRWIQRQRLNQAIRQIPPGVHVLDIGCHRGELFQAMGNRLGKGFGMDPLMPGTLEKQRFTLIKGNFPADWMMKTKMNCVTLL